MLLPTWGPAESPGSCRASKKEGEVEFEVLRFCFDESNKKHCSRTDMYINTFNCIEQGKQKQDF